MRLPRRVPWASINELEQVCSWIYSDENDLDAKQLAVNRLAAWKAITSLPHALESTHALLTVILQDMARQGQGNSSFLALRQSYATAIIRLVNGLVDPLQLGAYARSINSIAAQLGLPAWLVELRHAATHEDLPSIEVLREAARQALAWLLQNYFLPTLNPSSSPSASQLKRPSLRSLSPLLKQYKAFAKATARDASLAAQYKHDITRVLRNIERWISEAMVVAPVPAMAWDDIDGEEEEEGDPRERWALERLAEALLEKGALVPVSKKKRMLSAVAFHPSPSVLSIWATLITHVQSLHPTLPAILISKIIEHLGSTAESSSDVPLSDADVVLLDAEGQQEKLKQDASYDRCVAGWASWLVDTYSRIEDDEDEASEASVERTDVVLKLVSTLGPTKTISGTREKAVQDLLRALSRGRPTLEKASALVLNMPQPTSSGTWQEADMQLMHDRLAALLTARGTSSTTGTGTPQEVTTAVAGQGTDDCGSALRLPVGWRKISREDGWRPSPIGVFVPCTVA